MRILSFLNPYVLMLSIDWLIRKMSSDNIIFSLWGVTISYEPQQSFLDRAGSLLFLPCRKVFCLATQKMIKRSLDGRDEGIRNWMVSADGNWRKVITTRRIIWRRRRRYVEEENVKKGKENVDGEGEVEEEKKRRKKKKAVKVRGIK